MLTVSVSFAGHHLVPEPAREDETGHGRTEEGRRECEDPDHSERLPRKRQRHESAQEKVCQCAGLKAGTGRPVMLRSATYV